MRKSSTRAPWSTAVMPVVVVEVPCDLGGAAATVYGDGEQTRSFCSVDDLVRDLMAMPDSDQPGPVSLGNPGEFTVVQPAVLVREMTGHIGASPVPGAAAGRPSAPPPGHRPGRRRLGWRPVVDLAEGLGHTIDWFRSCSDELRGAEVTVAG
jgi:dTDP-glucose 4,6-dehydratase